MSDDAPTPWPWGATHQARERCFLGLCEAQGLDAVGPFLHWPSLPHCSPLPPPPDTPLEVGHVSEVITRRLSGSVEKPGRPALARCHGTVTGTVTGGGLV